MLVSQWSMGEQKERELGDGGLLFQSWLHPLPRGMALTQLIPPVCKMSKTRAQITGDEVCDGTQTGI